MSKISHSTEPSTSVSLLQRMKAGDANGWRQLAQIYGPIVYGWARRCGCQNADAADVMQDTFAAVAGAIDRFDYDRPNATFRGWLWTIARNKIRDQAKDVANDHAIGGTDAMLQMQSVAGKANERNEVDEHSKVNAHIDSEQPPSEWIADTTSARLRACELVRQSFDPRSWRMFWETAVQGRQPAVVAEEMQVSRWAVYKARARVLQCLQQQMAGLD